MNNSMMPDQPKVDNLLHISWCDSMWVPHLNAGNVLEYFSERSNPFYSRDCNNEFIKMQQNARIDALTQMQGKEYMLLHAQDPILYIVRKQQRFSPTHVTPLASYHIIAGQVFQTPDIGTVINSRLASTMSHINSSFSELSSYSQYHPSKGYWWHFHNKPQHQQDQQLANKEAKEKKVCAKEEAATLFQRRRVENLLQDITLRFPFRPPPPLGEETAAATPVAAAGQSAAPAATLPATGSPPLNIKLEDIKQEDRPELRPDIKMEIKQEIKTEVKSELPQSSSLHQQHFQRNSKPPPEKRPRLN